jgi:hypothetical protein
MHLLADVNSFVSGVFRGIFGERTSCPQSPGVSPGDQSFGSLRPL